MDMSLFEIKTRFLRIWPSSRAAEEARMDKEIEESFEEVEAALERIGSTIDRITESIRETDALVEEVLRESEPTELPDNVFQFRR